MPDFSEILLSLNFWITPSVGLIVFALLVISYRKWRSKAVKSPNTTSSQNNVVVRKSSVPQPQENQEFNSLIPDPKPNGAIYFVPKGTRFKFLAFQNSNFSIIDLELRDLNRDKMAVFAPNWISYGMAHGNISVLEYEFDLKPFINRNGIYAFTDNSPKRQIFELVIRTQKSTPEIRAGGHKKEPELDRLEQERKAKESEELQARLQAQKLAKEQLAKKEAERLRLEQERKAKEAEESQARPTNLRGKPESKEKPARDDPNGIRLLTKVRVTTNPYSIDREEQIVLIESVPDQGKSEPKRIGYNPTTTFFQNEPYKYGVVKMPPQNCLIKFPRKGRSAKRGYKEDEFFGTLKKYFQDQFLVQNDRHVPTSNGRPYEPDFVLSTEKENKNIFINIEIDEPYDGWERTPTHCIGDDDTRDNFFTQRGWIVIRLAEIQVHHAPVNCCALIAKVISEIDSSFESELLNMEGPNPVDQWNSLQAKNLSLKRYREEYLGITDFGRRPNTKYEWEISDCDSDKAVEREAIKNQVKATISVGSLVTDKENHRDQRIEFDPKEHRYFIDGNPDTISVTQLIDKFFPEFDAPYWAPIKAFQRGISVEEILQEWEDKRVKSATIGTELHSEIEKYFNGEGFEIRRPEYQHFLTFANSIPDLTPYKSEWKIFDEDLLVAGTLDMIFKDRDGSLHLYDWKRSEKVVKRMAA